MQNWEKDAGSCDEILTDGEVVVRAGLVMVQWDIPKEESLHIIEGFEEDRPCVGSAIMTCRGRKRRSVCGANARLTGAVSDNSHGMAADGGYA